MGDRTNLIASFEVDSLFPTDITFTLSSDALWLLSSYYMVKIHIRGLLLTDVTIFFAKKPEKEASFIL